MPTEFLNIDQLMTAAVAFLRIGGIMFIIPFFGEMNVPLKVKVLLSVAVSMTIVPLLPTNWVSGLSFEVLPITVLILKELFIGLIIGFTAKLAFEGLLLASSMVSYQMGFGVSNLIAPGTDVQLDAFSSMHRVVVILLFLSLNLHHLFFSAVVQTFEYIPAGQSFLNAEIGTHLIETTGNIFSTAVQLAAPVVVALLFATAGLGLVARAVPQMNVFSMSFPISFMIGIVIYIASTPFFPSWLRDHHIESTAAVFQSIKGMTPY
jgi:flagellar biosynthetic protein FliR